MEIKVGDIIKYDPKYLERSGYFSGSHFHARRIKIIKIENHSVIGEFCFRVAPDPSKTGRKINLLVSDILANYLLEAAAPTKNHQHPLTGIFK